MKKMMMLLAVMCVANCIHAIEHECCVTMSPDGSTYTVDKSGCVAR